uniref:Arrestin domain-containing protein 3-like n=1 Tax=Phallusia mammillata TaxID=59560 RepID=A0A6F9D6N4_9ASCI|nr:arrestin domain-containing protein 3-like [Phallusia mammillata]
MGKARIHVETNDNRVIFTPGEFVSGNLVIDANESLDFKKIEMKFKGQAYVHWSERRGSGKRRRTVHYSARETYFKQAVVVADSGGNTKLPQGRNVYPFQFQLPNDLPSSIEVSGGYVRYIIKGKIDRSGFFNDIKTMMLFTVLDCIDLNQNANTLTPSSGSDEKQLCCWCCSSGPIEGTIATDRSAYVPGEFITISGSIENHSSTDLTGCQYSIFQQVTQRATRKTRSFPVEIVTNNGPGCKRHSSAQISNQRIQIPALPPSPLRFCNIIDIRYYVQLCVETPTCHINLRIPAPIGIGTVPLQMAGRMPQPSAPPMSTEDHAAEYAPPPSYSAATAVNIETKATYEGTATTFAPQYNYYDWSQSAFTYNK